jgi:hypothetical protein
MHIEWDGKRKNVIIAEGRHFHKGIEFKHLMMAK